MAKMTAVDLVMLTACFVCQIQDGQTSYLSYKKPAYAYSVKYGTDTTGVTDGNDYALYGEWCYHSDGKSSNEWVRVDLQKEYNVTSVTVINRASTYKQATERLANTDIRISFETEIGSGQMCGNLVTYAQTETSPIIDFTCLEGIRGRHVILMLQNMVNYMNFCEIRVYSEDSPDISKCF
ncbi:fucolectin-like [Antedon mediterranea]|uniref:fucolectin-like n=1 Tax=Antedon mediterranea TaxID=105859 RepID=UPI003AF4B7CB